MVVWLSYFIGADNKPIEIINYNKNESKNY
jgi:hypothetical protein